ncbi:MAG: hypothetical protein AB4041_06080 [Microcystaceae cyanobacterium]
MKLNETIDTFFNRASVAINNALTTDKIQAYLKEYGYTPEKIKQGKTLYETALKAQQKQRQEYGEQMGATESFNQLWTQAKESYMRCLKIARIAFKKDVAITTSLGLNGTRKQSFSGWLSQANQFFENALTNPQVLAGLAEYNITKAKLQAAQADTKAVETASLIQEKEKGDAQNATKIRDKALDELNDWLSDFIAIARIALESEPQLLESLGITVSS